jgi:hypothetical protein
MFDGCSHPPGTVIPLTTYHNGLPVIVGPLPPVPGDPLHYAKSIRVPHDYRTYKVDDVTGEWMTCMDSIRRWEDKGQEVPEGYRLAVRQMEDVLEARGEMPEWMRAKSPRAKRLP